MKLDIQIDMAQVQKDLKKTQLEMNRAISKSLLKTAQYGTQIILDRTAKGVGYEGKFRAYSPAYRKAKAEGWNRAGSGRRAFGGDASGIVNLTVHGEMLSSIQQRSLGSNVVEIFFGRATEAKKAAFNNQKRKFFGFNQSEAGKLNKFFLKELK
jgi:hypothetical protein